MDTEQAMRIVLKMAKREQQHLCSGGVIPRPANRDEEDAIEEVENYLNASTLMDDSFWKGGYVVGPTGCDYGIGG
tara:strand:+ start:44 stop:268 length:225 start_codon:yes stop_codon:yes gene_type:complete